MEKLEEQTKKTDTRRCRQRLLAEQLCYMNRDISIGPLNCSMEPGSI